jgi:hypothetical protein
VVAVGDGVEVGDGVDVVPGLAGAAAAAGVGVQSACASTSPLGEETLNAPAVMAAASCIPSRRRAFLQFMRWLH